MPIYEYKCKKCDKVFEVLQKINSEPLKKCIYCDGKVEKLISVSSFQFKGNGWYDTDYKKKDTVKKQHSVKTESIKTETKKDSVKTVKKDNASKNKNENAA